MSIANITPEQTAHEARKLTGFVSGFMTDPATYAYAAELGFEGNDFYVAGRGGALGDVPAGVVTAAFIYFEPGLVRAAWERSAAVMSRPRAAEEWAGRCHAWAREHLPDDRDWPTLAALVGRVSANASVAGAPLFAGWRSLAEPADPRAGAPSAQRAPGVARRAARCGRAHGRVAPARGGGRPFSEHAARVRMGGAASRSGAAA